MATIGYTLGPLLVKPFLATITRPGGALTPKLPAGARHRVKNWTQRDLLGRKIGSQKDLDITEIRGQKDLLNIHIV